MLVLRPDHLWSDNGGEPTYRDAEQLPDTNHVLPLENWRRRR
jgi:hypothetical protein